MWIVDDKKKFTEHKLSRLPSHLEWFIFGWFFCQTLRVRDNNGTTISKDSSIWEIGWNLCSLDDDYCSTNHFVFIDSRECLHYVQTREHSGCGSVCNSACLLVRTITANVANKHEYGKHRDWRRSPPGHEKNSHILNMMQSSINQILCQRFEMQRVLLMWIPISWPASKWIFTLTYVRIC